MKVLVTGATGYIGGAVARAFRRAGHIVHGLVRSPEKEVELLKAEIIPVRGHMGNVSEWVTDDLFEGLSVIVDTATSKDTAEGSVLLLQKLKEYGQKYRNVPIYIYTSGCLVYGDQKGRILSEADVCRPPAFLQWRKDLEDRIIDHRSAASEFGVAPVVLRPGFVYGGNGGHYAIKWFEQGEKGDVIVKGDRNKRYSWVHVDDLADAYLRVSEAPAQLVSGNVYNVGDNSRYTFEQVVVGMGRAAGFKGEPKFEPAIQNDPFHSFVDIDCLTSSEKIEKALGWHPRQQPLLDLVHLYYLSWKSSSHH